MKQVKILMALILVGMWGLAQTVTPNPGPYQNISTKYQYTWQKWSGGIWNTGKTLLGDTVQISGPAYVLTPADGDSSTRIANTSWIKRNITPGIPGAPSTVWQFLGNYSPSDPTLGRMGFKDSFPLNFITDNEIRLLIPAAGILRSAGAANKVLMIDTVTKAVYYADMTGGGGSGSGITSLGSGYGLTNVNDSTYKVDTTVTGLSGKYMRLSDAVSYNFTSLANGDLLRYNSTGTYFENFTPAYATLTGTETLTNKTLTAPIINGATIATSTVNGVTLTTGGSATNYLSADGTYTTPAGGGGGMAIGGGITSATAGSVLFAGTSGILAQDNAGFNWDNTTKHLGVVNSVNTGSGLFSATNNAGIISGIGSYGTTHVIGNEIAGNSLVYSTGNLSVVAGASSATGSGGYLSFRTDGYAFTKDRMRIFANGTIGVNQITDSLSAKMIINGSILSPTHIGGTTTTSPLTFQTTTGMGTTGADHIFKVGNNGATEAMRILNNGNVGIGSNAPANALVVSRATNATDGIYITNTSSGNAARALLRLTNNASEIGQLSIWGSGVSGLANKTFFEASKTFVIGADANTASGGTSKVQIYVNGFNFATTPQFTFDATGNFGIGTTISTPTALLHLKAGTATASTAPIKFTSGTQLTTPEAGVLEGYGIELKYSTSTTAASRGYVGLDRYVATATSLTADVHQSTINVTATGQTITLPTAGGIGGRIYTIKLTASGTCTIDANASETIDGALTYTLSAQYKYVTIQSTGNEWIIIGNN